jgi:aspartate racemase
VEEGEVAATIGILGGMGPLATASFFSTLVRITEVDHDQDHLHVIIDSDPSIPDRTQFLLGRGPDPRPSILESALRLETAGADMLVMPCNTANAFAVDLEIKLRVPIVPWLEITADASAAGGIKTVGLLATEGTVRTEVYQRLLGARGLAVVVPDELGQRIVNRAVYGRDGVKVSGSLSELLQAALLQVARQLTDAGAERLVLGCTELPLGIPSTDPRWPIPAVDPSRVVAAEVVRRAGARVKSVR